MRRTLITLVAGLGIIAAGALQTSMRHSEKAGYTERDKSRVFLRDQKSFHQRRDGRHLVAGESARELGGLPLAHL
jgi:hypothetical protein